MIREPVIWLLKLTSKQTSLSNQDDGGKKFEKADIHPGPLKIYNLYYSSLQQSK